MSLTVIDTNFHISQVGIKSLNIWSSEFKREKNGVTLTFLDADPRYIVQIRHVLNPKQIVVLYSTRHNAPDILDVITKQEEYICDLVELNRGRQDITVDLKTCNTIIRAMFRDHLPKHGLHTFFKIEEIVNDSFYCLLNPSNEQFSDLEMWNALITYVYCKALVIAPKYVYAENRYSKQLTNILSNLMFSKGDHKQIAFLKDQIISMMNFPHIEPTINLLVPGSTSRFHSLLIKATDEVVRERQKQERREENKRIHHRMM